MRREVSQSGASTSPQPEGDQSAAPVVTLPKGGGAIRGMGEKFAASPVTGTGSMAVPIATSPGRSGFGPQLSLTYDSAAGNGPFGFGWNLSLPSVTRKTEKGLPQYLDSSDSDVFILSGAEDLVPVLVQDASGKWVPERPPPRMVDGETYRIRPYRPRIEGLFARIERWTSTANATDVSWRSISKDNITTWYGKTADSRIADPADPSRVFSWLICESYDDKGNVIVYGYKAEDSAKVFEDSSGRSLTKTHEINRTGQSRSAQRYIKRIRYGNRSPYFPTFAADAPWPEPPDASAPDGGKAWLFEAVFDYGEHDTNSPTPNAAGNWPLRSDPFSSYRAGFEVRTYRICQRVLMFHHFPGEVGVERDCLVRSTDFTYSDEVNPTDVRNPIYTFLKSVTQTGYRRDNGGYAQRSLPPVEFEYTEPRVQEALDEVDPESLENVPIGLDGSTYRWTDLHGEGIPGILTEQANTWFYKPNLSPVPQKLPDGGESVKARFAPLETVTLKPNVALSSGADIMDLAGDGQPDVVVMEDPLPGLYEHDEAEGWQPFRPFTSRLNRDPRDPNLKFIDLDGDGHADVLISEDDAFVWHASLAEQGFGPARRVAQALDDEKGPRIVFADGAQSIYLADLSGDGLTDIVRIRNGEVCYWPNLGYCRFGPKVTMDNAPWFDQPDHFDHKRLRLADIDGSGTTDIIYLHPEGVRLYFNQSGNGWSQPQMLKVFPRVDELVSIVPTDLLGNGTACLVWSSPLPGDALRPMRYVNLMGGRKPHLLVKTVNNLGAETRVDYAPSTKFYLQDKQAGQRWITRLPFPVHVVERVETYDHISRNRFVTQYAYHHGYFDGEEREFRGFGMVEQWDTEQFAALAGGTIPVDNIAAASHVPPVHTKTWFHTGVYLGRERVSRHFEGEYFREPGLTIDTARPLLLDDTTVPPGLPLEEEREACRALKGSMLRQEVYADDAEHPDATPEQNQRARTPYTVTEQSFSIRILQPHGTNRHAVFFTHPREAISYHYERNPADPRIQHALTLEVDDHGNVLKQAAIGYGRRTQVRVVEAAGNVQLVPNPGLTGLHPADQAKQTTPLLTYTENCVTNAVESRDTHRNPLPCEAITFELTGYTATGLAGRYQASDFVEPDPAAPSRLRHKFTAPEVAYESTATGNQRRRRIEWLRTLYRRDDLNGLLPLGDLEPLALPGESYKLAFTPGLLAHVFQRPRAGLPTESLLPDPAAVLGGQAGDRGGYLLSQTLKADDRFPTSDADDHWWIPSGQSFYSTNPDDDAATELAQARRHFFLPRRYLDPFGQNAFVAFDAHDLLMVETRDALDNRVTVDANDYRVLQPCLVSDPNRNRTEVAFDTLGMVVGTAVMGKPLPAPAEGDSLTGFVHDLTQAQIDAFFSAADPHADAATLLRDATTRIVYDLDRFRRTQQATPADPARWKPACAATLARETHVSSPLPPQGLKIQLSFSYSDGFGREIQKKIQAEPGPLDLNDPQASIVSPRWVGSGWTLFNNKGKPVRHYEPFFDDTHNFKFAAIHGVSPVLFYDPAERVIATLHPNHSYEKVVFDPWQQTTWDVNDTCAARNAQTGDPRTDPDISGFVAAYFETQPGTWLTWHAQRIGGILGQDERNAAVRAAAHADTPTTAHFDSLGRPFLTVARNRVVCPGHDLDGTEESLATRVELDIEGNQRAVRDAIEQAGDPLGRIVMRYAYDILGNRIHQLSMEAGARWMLSDIAGQPIRAWDSRGHRFRNTYDELRRPIEAHMRLGDEAELLVGRSVYGESQPDPEVDNLRGQVIQLFDQAGIVISEAYDFKGNLLHSRRQLALEYKTTLNWSADVPVEMQCYTSETRYDALSRPTELTAPDGSVIKPTYNQANLLDSVEANLRGATVSTQFVCNIDYDAEGHRTFVVYGNGVRTCYEYDPETFRLVHMKTLRSSEPLQDLHYTYDPVGNITHIQDDAQQTIFFRNQRIDSNNDYIYDAVYRLIEASGREHLGQTAGQRNPPTAPDAFNAFHTRSEHPGDGRAMGTYVERYAYDSVGNILAMKHRGSDPAHSGWTRDYNYDEFSLIEPSKNNNRLVGNILAMKHRGSDPAHSGWTRDYNYDEFSLIEPSKNNNRLSRTTIGRDRPETYAYDTHGNITGMSHLSLMQWDYRDQLKATAQQVDSNGGMPEITYYIYDAGGQRVRKVTERRADAGLAPTRMKERVYLGGFEIFREHENDGETIKLERETLHIMDDQQRIALVETRTQGNDVSAAQLIRYQLGNHLGSASLEVDHLTQIISYEEYFPYGSTSYQALRSQLDAPKRYRYTGKERDEESGLCYHGARYYAPWFGRWTASDPAGLLDTLNLYAYVRNRPIAARDDTGFQTQEPDLDVKTGPYKSVGGHHPLQSASYTKAPGGKDKFRRPALSISQKEKAFTKELHKYADSVQLQFNRGQWGINVDKTIGVGEGVHIKAAGEGLLKPVATPWSEAVKGRYALEAAGFPTEQAVRIIDKASIERSLWGSVPLRVPNRPVLRGLASKASHFAGRAAAGLMPDPTDAAALLYDYFASFHEAKEMIRNRNFTEGFARGVAAGVLHMSGNWVEYNLKERVIVADLETKILSAEGIAEISYNKGINAGFSFTTNLNSKQIDTLQLAGFKVLAAEGYDASGDIFSSRSIRALGDALQPTILSILEQKRKAELKEAYKKYYIPVTILNKL
jgi:RHS repeat-associated protein